MMPVLGFRKKKSVTLDTVIIVYSNTSCEIEIKMQLQFS